ncbi:MAG TPA: ImmA/IrrE family metallo-endopeptidase [Stellaceae bacterium]|jgi:Zn-dependent peptidase ImmA (M78 family)|nr:ImmA/IrrE family metallo-endopeptidase [Stellaceae bacterium]
MPARRLLLQQAIQAASELRDATGFDQFGPADPYAAAERLGVKVVFLGASMEGFYFKGSPARILLSTLRPVPRRTFTCAHELGHHWFGHGSTIDQLQEDERLDSNKPDEILANGLAAFFLMPTVGLRGAFARRGWNMATASALQLFIVSCEFGVGYQTLLNHITYSLREISASRKEELEKWTPQRIRRKILNDDYDSLIIVDAHSKSPTFDVEKGAAVLLPISDASDNNTLNHVKSLPDYEVYHAAKRGIASINGAARTYAIRVMPKPYEGAAKNRFLEDPDEN